MADTVMNLLLNMPGVAGPAAPVPAVSLPSAAGVATVLSLLKPLGGAAPAAAAAPSAAKHADDYGKPYKLGDTILKQVDLKRAVAASQLVAELKKDPVTGDHELKDDGQVYPQKTEQAEPEPGALAKVISGFQSMTTEQKVLVGGALALLLAAVTVAVVKGKR